LVFAVCKLALWVCVVVLLVISMFASRYGGFYGLLSKLLSWLGSYLLQTPATVGGWLADSHHFTVSKAEIRNPSGFESPNAALWGSLTVSVSQYRPLPVVLDVLIDDYTLVLESPAPDAKDQRSNLKVLYNNFYGVGAGKAADEVPAPTPNAPKGSPEGEPAAQAGPHSPDTSSSTAKATAPTVPPAAPSRISLSSLSLTVGRILMKNWGGPPIAITVRRITYQHPEVRLEDVTVENAAGFTSPFAAKFRAVRIVLEEMQAWPIVLTVEVDGYHVVYEDAPAADGASNLQALYRSYLGPPGADGASAEPPEEGGGGGGGSTVALKYLSLKDGTLTISKYDLRLALAPFELRNVGGDTAISSEDAGSNLAAFIMRSVVGGLAEAGIQVTQKWLQAAGLTDLDPSVYLSTIADNLTDMQSATASVMGAVGQSLSAAMSLMPEGSDLAASLTQLMGQHEAADQATREAQGQALATVTATSKHLDQVRVNATELATEAQAQTEQSLARGIAATVDSASLIVGELRRGDELLKATQSLAEQTRRAAEALAGTAPDSPQAAAQHVEELSRTVQATIEQAGTAINHVTAAAQHTAAMFQDAAKASGDVGQQAQKLMGAFGKLWDR